MNALTGFLTCAFIIMFMIGYKFGRRVERWEQNHPKDKED